MCRREKLQVKNLFYDHGLFFKKFRVFMIMIISVLISHVIELIFSVLLLYKYYSKNLEKMCLISRLSYLTEADIIYEVIILVWISTVITLLIIIFDSNLVFFHLWLIKNKMSTYDYIVRRREKSKEKKQRKVLKKYW